MSFWTPEKEEEFIALWNAYVPAKEMAVKLGLGINGYEAVTSKAQRLVKRGRIVRRCKVGQNLQAKIVEKKTTLKVVEGEPAPVGGVRTEDLKKSHCRWPIGDPASDDFRFCGAKKAFGRSYCAHHYGIATESPAQRRARLNTDYRPSHKVEEAA